MAGGTGSSHHQQRKTERSRRGTPCCTYLCRMWIFQGASAGRTLFFCYTTDVPSRISHRRNCVNLTQFLSTAARTPHAYFKNNRFSDTPASAQERFSILWAGWRYPPIPAGCAQDRLQWCRWCWRECPATAGCCCPWSWVFRPAHGL